MIKLIKKSLLIVAVLTTIVATGTELKSNVNFKLIEAKLVDLSLKNNDGELQVRVKDTDGVVLYNESFDGLLFSKKYDLKNLPIGDYFFEIEGETKIKTMPFEVTSKAIEFKNEVKSIYFKPIVRQDGNLVFISKMTIEKEPMKVVLYDVENSSVLYKEEFSVSYNLGKKLNIEKLNPGTYKLVIVGDNKVFTEYIKR